MNAIKAAIFDLDGTLLDTETLSTEAIQQVETLTFSLALEEKEGGELIFICLPFFHLTRF